GRRGWRGGCRRGGALSLRRRGWFRGIGGPFRPLVVAPSRIFANPLPGRGAGGLKASLRLLSKPGCGVASTLTPTLSSFERLRTALRGPQGREREQDSPAMIIRERRRRA